MRARYHITPAFIFGSLTVLGSSCIQQSAPPIVRGSMTEIKVNSPQLKQFLKGAIEQTTYTRIYDPAYVAIAYPGGDVPRERGVCTDVVIRAFRTVGIDLQKTVHEDMAANFAAYPQDWGLSHPDPNIDHRRVPNLMTYFSRQGKAVPISPHVADYLPGDIVTWNLGDGQQHVGIITQYKSAQTRRPMIVHNVGAGTQLEDVLKRWDIIGHYRYQL